MFLPTKGMRRNYASSLRPSSRCCILIVSIAVLLLLLPATPRAARSAESEAKHVVDAAGTGGVDGIEQAHHLLWDNIKLEVSSKSSRSRRSSTADNTRQKQILRDVSGEALPGRLLAIMGPSGSGKSSLLNVLTSRVPTAKNIQLGGMVEIGSLPLRNFDTQRYVAYVRQEQDFYPFLTVKETLLITAGLRLDRSVTHAQKEKLVEDIMDKLGLRRAADTLVGDIRTPGVSGGEKRRLAMGLQLIGLQSPSIIFLDEPTSGLDSHQALQVMETVRDLCSEGHTVVVAIHQPRSSIYALFDDILLLSEGRVMYHGSTDDVLPRLASLGYKCPLNFNPADFMVDLISPVLISADESQNFGDSRPEAAKQESDAKLARLAHGDSVMSISWKLNDHPRNRSPNALNFTNRSVWAVRQRIPHDTFTARKDWKAKAAARKARRLQKNEKRHWWQRGIGNDSEDGETQQQKQQQPLDGDNARQASTGTRRKRAERQLAVIPAPSPGGGLVPASKSGVARSGWLTQFRLLLKRSWRQATRDKFAAMARVALGIGLGGVFGSIFWKLSLQESSIQNRVSLFVNVAMNTAMFGCIRALQTLAVERGVVALERMDEGYSASAYLGSKILAELPMDAVFPLLFGTTVYFAAGLNTPLGGSRKLAKYLGTLLVETHASSALGLMVGCLSPSMEVANLVGPAMIVVSLMLSGVHGSIPLYLKKLEAVSTIKWGIQGIVTNEMRDMRFIPDGKELLLGWKLGTNKQVIEGEGVMDKMGFKNDDLTKPAWRLLQLSAGFHTVTLLSLVLGTPKFQRLEGDSHTPQQEGTPSATDD